MDILKIPNILKMLMEKTVNQNNLQNQENEIGIVLPWLPRICKLFKPSPEIKKLSNLVLGPLNRGT